MRRYHLLLLLSTMGSLFILVLPAGCSLLGGGAPEGLLQVTPTGGTEVMLQVHAGRGEPVTIARGGEEVFAFTMTGADTLLTDRGLQPQTTYTWKAGIPGGQATTLDTTSHRFTWQTFRFGQHASSSLNDVALLGPDNIWAVGEIYRNDSTGTADPMPYNAAHWDGNQWTLKSLKYRAFTPVINSILAINEDNIWLDPWIHWDGKNFQQEDIPEELIGYSIKSMWGPSSNDFYVGGQNGNIVHHDSTGWQKIESSTTLDVYDIYGRGDWIIAVAGHYLEDFEKTIFRIDHRQTEALSTAGIPLSIHGLWLNARGVIYIVGDGIFRKPTPSAPGHWQRAHYGATDNFLQDIDANGLNDLWICGDFGELMHYNGATWKHYAFNFRGIFKAVQVQGDTVVAVGLDGGKAFVALGTRE